MVFVILLIFTMAMVGPINSVGLGSWFATGVSASSGLSLVVDKPKQEENRQFSLKLMDETALGSSDDPPSDEDVVENFVELAIPAGMILDLEETEMRNAATATGKLVFDADSGVAKVTWNEAATERVYELILIAEKRKIIHCRP